MKMMIILKESLEEVRTGTHNIEIILIVNANDDKEKNGHSKEESYIQMPRTVDMGMSFCFPPMMNAINKNP